MEEHLYTHLEIVKDFVRKYHYNGKPDSMARAWDSANEQKNKLIDLIEEELPLDHPVRDLFNKFLDVHYDQVHLMGEVIEDWEGWHELQEMYRAKENREDFPYE